MAAKQELGFHEGPAPHLRPPQVKPGENEGGEGQIGRAIDRGAQIIAPTREGKPAVDARDPAEECLHAVARALEAFTRIGIEQEAVAPAGRDMHGAGAAIRDGALATQPPIALHALTGGLALSRLLSPPGRGVVSGAPTDARASVVPSRAVRIRAIAGGAAASGLLGLGAVACVLPSQTAATCLLCAGDTMEVPAAAVRAAGATLLPLGTELFELIGAPAVGAPPTSVAGRRALCVSAACAAGGQAVSLCQGSHALRGWARGALIGGCGTCAAVALAELVDDVRASRPEAGQDLPKKPDGVPVWKRVGSIISRRGASGSGSE